ncbi:hypothetical protein [Isoptericola sp. QY 916]|uniref:hypothetical protein n=1 Tax=Isoptericola sp. QY 916 TaxID=2782570 RepID=UPI003D2FB2BC|nr:hypothetical protein [Isoptericola sp. QY 916]
MNEKVTAWLRTAVPALWGTLLAWALAQWALPAPLTELLSSDVLVSALVALAVGAWYALWRWLEPRLPAFVVRLVLGSARTPTYAPTSADGVPDITSAAVPLFALGEPVRAVATGALGTVSTIWRDRTPLEYSVRTADGTFVYGPDDLERYTTVIDAG